MKIRNALIPVFIICILMAGLIGTSGQSENVNDLVNKGIQSYKVENYKAAYDYFRRAMKIERNHPEASKWFWKMKNEMDTSSLKDKNPAESAVGTKIAEGEKSSETAAKKSEKDKAWAADIEKRVAEVEKRSTDLDKRSADIEKRSAELYALKSDLERKQKEIAAKQSDIEKKTDEEKKAAYEREQANILKQKEELDRRREALLREIQQKRNQQKQAALGGEENRKISELNRRIEKLQRDLEKREGEDAGSTAGVGNAFGELGRSIAGGISGHPVLAFFFLLSCVFALFTIWGLTWARRRNRSIPVPPQADNTPQPAFSYRDSLLGREEQPQSEDESRELVLDLMRKMMNSPGKKAK